MDGNKAAISSLVLWLQQVIYNGWLHRLTLGMEKNCVHREPFTHFHQRIVRLKASYSLMHLFQFCGKSWKTTKWRMSHCFRSQSSSSDTSKFADIHPTAGQQRQIMESKLLSAGSVPNPWWLSLVCKNRCNQLWAMVVHREKIILKAIKETVLSLVKEIMV